MDYINTVDQPATHRLTDHEPTRLNYLGTFWDAVKIKLSERLAILTQTIADSWNESAYNLSKHLNTALYVQPLDEEVEGFHDFHSDFEGSG